MTAKKPVTKKPVTKKPVAKTEKKNSMDAELTKRVNVCNENQFIVKTPDDETWYVIYIEKGTNGYNLLLLDAGFDDHDDGFTHWEHIDNDVINDYEIVNTIQITSSDKESIDKIKAFAKTLGVEIK